MPYTNTDDKSTSNVNGLQHQVLPLCPTCGSTVEMFFKETYWAGSAQIRCVGHHHIGLGYSPGGKAKAREMLISRWAELTRQVQQDKNNG